MAPPRLLGALYVKRWGPTAGLLLFAVGLLWTAREPASSAMWRVAFVVLSLGAVPCVAWAIHSARPRLGQVLGIAVALRVILLPLGPSLSDDGYRYLWDGSRTLRGVSPYADSPREVTEAGETGPVPLELLNSPDYHSVYPPVSQTFFAVAMWVGGSFGVAWAVLKLLFVIVEIGGVWALGLHVRPSLLAWYAWHPVAVVEVAGQGHTEGLAVGFLSLGLAASLASRHRWVGLWVVAAGWVKLWPFVLLAQVRRLHVAAWAAIAAGILAIPWLAGADVDGVVGSLRLYGGTFDFYAAPYTALKSALWPLAGEVSGTLASVVLAAGAIAAFAVIASKHYKTPRRWALTIAAVLLLSSTLHPWHLLPVLWAAILLDPPARRALIWLVSIAPLTYLVYVGYEWAMVVALVVGWGGALGLAMWPRVLYAILRYRGGRKWRRIRAALAADRSLDLLDLGCAEGYVGASAARDGHTVHLADLEDSRVVDLPFVKVSEHHVPLASDSQDAVLLVFVLHHAADPSSVLREASRIASQLVVWETVPAPWMPKPLLEVLDSIVNQKREAEMRQANLQTVQEWEARFDTLDLVVVRSERWGWGHPQALWLLERREDIPR